MGLTPFAVKRCWRGNNHFSVGGKKTEMESIGIAIVAAMAWIAFALRRLESRLVGPDDSTHDALIQQNVLDARRELQSQINEYREKTNELRNLVDGSGYVPNWEKQIESAAEQLRSLMMHSSAMLDMADHNYETISQEMPMDFNYAYALVKLSIAPSDGAIRKLEWKQSKIESVGLLRARKIDYFKTATCELELRDIEKSLERAERDVEVFDKAAHDAVGAYLEFKVDTHFRGRDGEEQVSPQ